MRKIKWNRRPPRGSREAEAGLPEKTAEFVVRRAKPGKRKRKHPGYTTISEHRLWIFENNNK